MARSSSTMPGAHKFARNRFILLLSLSLLAAPATGLAQTNERWRVDETQSRAILPPPRGNVQITGAALSCAAQRWRLDVDATGEVKAGDATLTVDGRAFVLSAIGPAIEPVIETAPGLAFAVPRAAIEPLKAGLRLEFALPQEEGNGAPAAAAASFSLRGSKLAINAAQERCTPRDMSAYTPVTFTPYSSYINLGRDLRKDDIAAFRQSTASEPKLDMAMVEFGDERRLLLTRLCGSSWYYGASGCNIAGFAPANDGWEPIYDTENVLLYSDPDSVIDGWPDLITLPAGQKGHMVAGPGLIWRWDGNAYALKGELPDDEPAGSVASKAVEQASGE